MIELLGVLSLVLCLPALCNGRQQVVDLTYVLNKDTFRWLDVDPFNLTIVNRGIADFSGKDLWFETNKFASGEHIGTHIDSPAHFGEGQWRTSEIPIGRLLGTGVVIDVKDKVRRNPNYRVRLGDLIDYEWKYGRIPNGAVVMMNSGWGARFPDRQRVFNTPNINDDTSFQFPGFHARAALWLANERNVHAVGVDTPSTDYGQSRFFPVHRVLSHYSIVGVESIANIDQIPEYGATVYLPVLKIDDGSGGPTRVFATYDDELYQPPRRMRNHALVLSPLSRINRSHFVQ